MSTITNFRPIHAVREAGRYARDWVAYQITKGRRRVKRKVCERFHTDEPMQSMVGRLYFLSDGRRPMKCRKCGVIRYIT